MSARDADAADEMQRDVTRGEIAFRAGERLSPDASAAFRAGWVAEALACRDTLAKVGPLAGHAREIRAALEKARFSLKNHASAKLRADAEKELGEARFAVSAALGHFPEQATRPDPAPKAPAKRARPARRRA